MRPVQGSATSPDSSPLVSDTTRASPTTAAISPRPRRWRGKWRGHVIGGKVARSVPHPEQNPRPPGFCVAQCSPDQRRVRAGMGRPAEVAPQLAYVRGPLGVRKDRFARRRGRSVECEHTKRLRWPSRSLSSDLFRAAKSEHGKPADVRLVGGLIRWLETVGVQARPVRRMPRSVPKNYLAVAVRDVVAPSGNSVPHNRHRPALPRTDLRPYPMTSRAAPMMVSGSMPWCS